jgi:hypothetical protein
MADKKPNDKNENNNDKKKKSSVRHTRAIRRDRSKRPLAAPPDEQITARLTELVLPTLPALKPVYRALGLRDRVLTLSVMVAIVLTLVWRQVGGGGTEIERLLHTEDLLWVPMLQVSQQAISERLRTFPSVLFLRLLPALLPGLQARRQARQRPLPPVLDWARRHYTAVLAVDGSTPDALLRKVGLLRQSETNPLAGRMMALPDVCSWLPRHLWYEEDAQAHDRRFWPKVLGQLQAGALLLIDLGFTNFKVFAQLTAQQVTFITRAKRNLSFKVERYLVRTAQVHDLLIWVGSGDERQLLRLVKVLYKGKWYCYLTNELDPARLPTEYVVALYRQRWRIEDAYHIVKRLLGLAYFWVGSQYGVESQVWATWILYAVLVDLTDAVAEVLDRPFVDLSPEMVYRSLYYFGQAYARGKATDPVAYIAANAVWLGVIKRKHRSTSRALLNLTNPADLNL